MKFVFESIMGSTNGMIRVITVMLVMSICLISSSCAMSTKFRHSRHVSEASLSEAQTPPARDIRLPATSAAQPNLFEEYMSRGLYTCTSSYLDSLGKLHALMAQVYEDYQSCQKLMKSTPKAFSKTDIDALDDMLADWEREDAAAAQSQQSAESVRSDNEPRSAMTPEPVVPARP